MSKARSAGRHAPRRDRGPRRPAAATARAPVRHAFEWNSYTDQPNNVAPKSERMRYHLRHAASYLQLTGANLWAAAPVLARYRALRKAEFRDPVLIPPGAVSCAVSEADRRSDEVVALLKETGVRTTLLRLGSWERKDLKRKERFARALRDAGLEVTLSLMQRRDDVLDPEGWRAFLGRAFDRFGPLCRWFELGHAWNRTKWGVWSHREYLRLAEPAFEAAARAGASLVGPAVIDFEFHLYPVTLPRLPFAKVSSLLYVDRVGAPENTQAGWDFPRKLALLRAVVDVCGGRSAAPDGRGGRRAGLWITEVNWPLAGTEPWSPAAGRPNVSESEQADYLARYYLLALASGHVERVVWWQMAAPGYGLVDPRDATWRKRPSFAAFATMRRALEGATFLGRMNGGAGAAERFFLFRGPDGAEFAVAWTCGSPGRRGFERPIARIVDRDGREELAGAGDIVLVTGSPKYVYFR